jgi:hypothetical protein
MSLKKNWINKMWAIIKIDKKKISQLQNDFREKLGKDYEIYNPEFLIQKYKNNKLINKKFSLLGDYFFCFHEDFKKIETLNKIKFCRGLKYVLSGFKQSQKEIEIFIERCKNSENNLGYLSNNFYALHTQSKYKFNSGPFVEKIFQIINLQKNKIDILMGNVKTSVNRKKFLFSPI